MAVKRQIDQLADSSLVPASKLPDALVMGWSKAVDEFLDDNLLSEEEEARLQSFSDAFGLSIEELNRRGGYARVAKSKLLRDVVAGRTLEDLRGIPGLPFNLLKTEVLVWVERDVQLLEDRTRRQYVGGSQGVSIRVMKGVYYRVGAFKASPVDTQVTVHVDTGLLGVTTKHLYFAGPKRSLRTPYNKVVSFAPYSNGIGVVRDAASAKPQSFITGDGWFIYNLVTNLAQR